MSGPRPGKVQFSTWLPEQTAADLAYLADAWDVPKRKALSIAVARIRRSIEKRKEANK